MKRPVFTPEGVAACLVGLVVYGVASWGQGLGVSPDSVSHLATAQSVLTNGTFYSYDLAPYVWWPPLFPSLLATLAALGLALVDAAWVLNGVALCGIVFGAGVLLREHLASRSLAAAATLLVAVAYPLHFIFGKVWSEPVFIMLALLSVVALTCYVRTPNLKWLLLAATLVALTMLQRTAGAGVAATGAACILFIAPTRSVRTRLIRVTVFNTIVAAPMMVWVLRNLTVSDTAVGVRGASTYSLADNVYQMLFVITSWFVPGRLLVPQMVALATAGSIVIAVWAAFLHGRGLVTRRVHVRTFLPVALFFAAHVGVTLAAAGSVALDRLDTRLLSPVFPILVLFTLVSVETTSRWLAEVLKRPIVRGIGGVLAVLLLSAKPVLQSAQLATGQIGDNHHDFQSARWADSEVIERLREMSPGRLLFSNRPDAIYFQSGLNATLSPRKMLYNSPETAGDDLTDRLETEISETGSAYLVWFERAGNGYLYPLDELGSMYDLEVVADLTDGTIFTVSGI